ncbi:MULTISPECIES: MFS transporter [Streptomyces]|uniref:MFS transporter n=1 Tax=Streptomyces cheonanensis TaxID=312720 RepID=A0ABP5GDT4_9ACTN
MPSLNKFRAGSERGARTAGGADPRLRQLRYALTAFFAVDGFVFAGWVVRIPAVKEQTGASASALGLALLGVSAGAVVTMTLTGRLCQRLGNHPVTVGAALLLSASVALPPHAHSAVVLGAVLLFFGAGFGGMNVAVNSAAVDLVAALGRPVMPGFHAAFSLGGMVGAGAGGLVAGSLSPAWHLSGLALIGVLVTVVAGRALLAAPVPVPPRASDAGADAAGDRPAAGPVGWLVVVLGVVAACTAYGEGALADWSALHLRETLLASEGLAAAGYSVFALAMTVGRLSGTWLLLRLGQTRAMVAGGTVAAAGMLLASLAPSVGLALVGFVVTGLGLANLFPVAIGQAGALAGPRGVAAASTVGYGGMLLGPVAIGFLAEWFSLAAALTSVAALSAVAAVIAYALRGSAPDAA